MANHKYRNTRNQRAGCKMCKPWKINGNNKNYGYTSRPPSDMRVLQEDVNEELEDYYEELDEYIEDYLYDIWDSREKFLKEYNLK